MINNKLKIYIRAGVLTLAVFFGSFSMLFSSAIVSIPETIDTNKDKVALEKKLFFDPILSRYNTISCALCHDLQDGGDDGRRFSFGVEGREGSINSPTVYSTVFNFRKFWDGRAKNLIEQVLEPIENHVEMDSSMPAVVKKLKKIAWHQKHFGEIYENGITTDNVTGSIAEFEKALVTPNAPFDRYLKGDKKSISRERKGIFLVYFKGVYIVSQRY